MRVLLLIFTGCTGVVPITEPPTGTDVPTPTQEPPPSPSPTTTEPCEGECPSCVVLNPANGSLEFNPCVEPFPVTRFEITGGDGRIQAVLQDIRWDGVNQTGANPLPDVEIGEVIEHEHRTTGFEPKRSTRNLILTDEDGDTGSCGYEYYTYGEFFICD